MAKLNHSRPIASGDIMKVEWQKECASGKKNPPRGSLGGMLDMGCEFSEEALDERDRIIKKHGKGHWKEAIQEIRRVRMEKNRATMRRLPPAPPQNPFLEY